MPIYDYICLDENCKHSFEVIKSWNDTTEEKCPKCGKITKKIPSRNATMKANWSQWRAI